jgi:SAM-dependent methyltransferase
MQFGEIVLNFENCFKKDILEVGSRNVNGSLRDFITQFSPNSYFGIDMEQGQGVDYVLSIHNLTRKFGQEKVDLLICTEVMEHVQDWQEAILEMKLFVKIGGSILLTTRSKGFKRHEYPADYWRYSLDDMKRIFADFEIEMIAEDGQAPGVFIFAKRLFKEVSVDPEIKLYSMENEK